MWHCLAKLKHLIVALVSQAKQVQGTTRCVSLQVMKSLRFARLGLHSFWEVDFTMCVCYCRLTLLGLLGFCELYFADLILSLLISSWLVCCVRFVVTRLLCFFKQFGLVGQIFRVDQVCRVMFSMSGLLSKNSMV